MLNISKNYAVSYSQTPNYKNNKNLATFPKFNQKPVSFRGDVSVLDKLILALKDGAIREAFQKNPERSVELFTSIQEALSGLQKAADFAPRGHFKREGTNLQITSFDSENGLIKEGKITNLIIPENVKIYAPGTSANEILQTSFDKRPFVTLSPSGWSSIKTDGIDKSSCNMDYWGKDQAAQRKILQAAYKKDFMKFMEPIFECAKMLGLDTDRIAIVSSFSDCGIDQAAMEFATANNHKLITVGPYKFVEYANTQRPHQFPIVLENTVSDYGNKFAELSDIMMVMGGRDHTWLFDTKNQFIGKKGTTFPADLLDMYHGLKIAATKADGSIENSARVLKELGLNPFSNDVKAIFERLPKEVKKKLVFDEQKAVFVRMLQIYKARETAASLAE